MLPNYFLGEKIVVQEVDSGYQFNIGSLTIDITENINSLPTSDLFNSSISIDTEYDKDFITLMSQHYDLKKDNVFVSYFYDYLIFIPYKLHIVALFYTEDSFKKIVIILEDKEFE